jgi:hypothetical protein
VNINVVFHVNGRLIPNDFAGVRIGRLDKRKALLVVQAAVPANRETDRRKVLISLLKQSIMAAEQHVIQRGLAVGLPQLQSLVDRIA